MLNRKRKDYEGSKEKKWQEGLSHLFLYLGQAFDATGEEQQYKEKDYQSYHLLEFHTYVSGAKSFCQSQGKTPEDCAHSRT